MLVTAIVIIIGGAVVALLGAALSVVAARKVLTEDGPTAGSDIAVAVTVVGIVAMLLGVGYLGFVLLTQG